MKWDTRKNLLPDYTRYMKAPKTLSPQELLLLPEPPTLADLDWVKSKFNEEYTQILYIVKDIKGLDVSHDKFYIVKNYNDWSHAVYFCTQNLKDRWDNEKFGRQNWTIEENDPRFIALYKCLTRDYYDD